MVHNRWNLAFCRVLWNDDEAVIVFRGTKYHLTDWCTNLQAWPCLKKTRGDKTYFVHTGFDKALDSKQKGTPAFEKLLEIIKPHIAAKKKIFITGHSLGGALAVLAGHRINELYEGSIEAIYTFGQPAVGGKGFKHAYKLANRTYRICSGVDIVTFLPGPFYHHVGTQYWIHNGQMSKNVHWTKRIWKSIKLMLTILLADHDVKKYIRYSNFFKHE